MKRNRIILSIAVLVYITQLVWKKNDWDMPEFLGSYLADLLCIPIVLSIALFALRKIKKSPPLQLTWKMILFACLYMSLVFEYLLPMYSGRYTADIMDVVSYFAGGLVFYKLQDS